MAFVPVSDTAMIEVIYNHANQVMENTFYYSGLNVNDADVLLGLATNAFLMWQNTFKLYQATSLKVAEVKATDLSTENGPTASYVPTGGEWGTAVGDALPANCALLLSLKTANRGKSYRGRIYVPGLVENAQATSAWGAAVLTAFDGYFGDWEFLEHDGEPYGLQVVSRYHNGAPRTVGVHTQVDTWITRPYVCSQRRRLPGRGI